MSRLRGLVPLPCAQAAAVTSNLCGDTDEEGGVKQPRVSDLMRGKINLFSLETLIDMLARAGAHVKLSVRFNKRAA